jgi:CelD/BcsL family acetyltransferase involved in cellulose biosynthesis
MGKKAAQNTAEILWLKNLNESSIEPETWNTILAKSRHNNIFLTWEWLSTWWKHFQKDQNALLLLIKASDEIKAIAPLMLRTQKAKALSLNIIQFIGTGLSDYGDLILLRDEKKCIQLFFDFMEEHHINWDLIDLRNIPGDSPTINLLREVADEKGYGLMTKETICRCIPLAQPWETYFSNLPGSMRKQLRQNLRRAEEKYSMAITYAENLQSLIEVFFATYSEWLEKRYSQNSLFGIPFNEVKSFLTDFTNKALNKGWVSLSFLTLDEKPVSSYYGFTYNDTFLLYMTSWNPEFAYYGIGNLHTMSLIKYSIENGLNRFDFLRGDEKYKTRWNSITKNNVRVIIFSKGIKGKLANIAMRMIERRGLRRLLRRIVMEKS